MVKTVHRILALIVVHSECGWPQILWQVHRCALLPLPLLAAGQQHCQQVCASDAWRCRSERSEERRVGKECRLRGWPKSYTKGGDSDDMGYVASRSKGACEESEATAHTRK